jgi:hypothetical protein
METGILGSISGSKEAKSASWRQFWRHMLGPDILARTKGHRHPADGQSLDDHPISTMNHHLIKGMRESGRKMLQWILVSAEIVLVVLLSSEDVRHKIAESAATFCVLGGFIAAPILTITAWIDMIAPEVLPLHHLSTPLFLIAIIWLALAFIGAHLHHSRQLSRGK